MAAARDAVVAALKAARIPVDETTRSESKAQAWVLLDSWTKSAGVGEQLQVIIAVDVGHDTELSALVDRTFEALHKADFRPAALDVLYGAREAVPGRPFEQGCDRATIIVPTGYQRG